MGPILNLMDLANALARTLEDSSCFREETLPCRVASPPNSLLAKYHWRHSDAHYRESFTWSQHASLCTRPCFFIAFR